MAKFIDNNGLLYIWTKLKTMFAGKVHTHAMSDVTGLEEALSSMSPSSNVYKFKGTKATYEELPTSGNEVGDVWNVTGNNGMNYVWTGTEWDALGATYEIEALSNSEIDQIMV